MLSTKFVKFARVATIVKMTNNVIQGHKFFKSFDVWSLNYSWASFVYTWSFSTINAMLILKDLWHFLDGNSCFIMTFAWTFSVWILAKISNFHKLLSFLVFFPYRIFRQHPELDFDHNFEHFVPTCVYILIDSYEWVLQDIEVRTTKLPFFFNNKILPFFSLSWVWKWLFVCCECHHYFYLHWCPH